MVPQEYRGLTIGSGMWSLKSTGGLTRGSGMWSLKSTGGG